jgi:hypothetical protein
MRAGGRMTVIIDNKDEDVEKIIMVDDATGSGTLIPSLMIGKTEGEKLLDFMDREKNSLMWNKVVLQAKFHIVGQFTLSFRKTLTIE